MDVLEGNYKRPDEMLGRARLLGYDLITTKIVTIFELSPDEPEYPAGSPQAQWSKRLRDELLRTWPVSWVSNETRRVLALLPIIHSIADIADAQGQKGTYTRLDRLQLLIQHANASNP